MLLSIPVTSAELPRNWTLLKRLKNSRRNWSLTRSVSLKFLYIEKSVLAIPGPEHSPTDELPNVPNWKLSIVQAAGFSHWNFGDPEGALQETPETRLGRVSPWPTAVPVRPPGAPSICGELAKIVIGVPLA